MVKKIKEHLGSGEFHMSIAFFISLGISKLLELPKLGLGVFIGYPIIMLLYLNFFKRDE